eukprot:Plantae.Rhodophyta-Hildenbrandia_rubra.ctg33633.p1 GENE.Plantae.Rhodophyta-Hildenbrandia_rubra.ctg33633~~Plantae.Rhodophyta-Hildenbrandia_rubra.ctg33633.p1  ORF type:complete len:185 (-),score=33.66 Plantae.Rhodophyta-Hildenbrandia_rubra.ctg33633:669-1223(-)
MYSLLIALILVALLPPTASQQPPAPTDQYCSITPTMERTFLMIKPDGVQRGLVSEIISRFERKGFKLVALKLQKPTLQKAQQHYSDLSSKSFYEDLCKFLSSGPVVAMVWEGEGVVKTARFMMGETDPKKSLPGSIRGDFSVTIGRNVLHGSDSVDSAKKEIEFWFKEEEVVGWKKNDAVWVYE